MNYFVHFLLFLMYYFHLICNYVGRDVLMYVELRLNKEEYYKNFNFHQQIFM
jgi:hypothetical protein